MCLFSQTSLILPVKRLEINDEFWLIQKMLKKEFSQMNFLYTYLEIKFLSQNNSLSGQLITPPRHQER